MSSHRNPADIPKAYSSAEVEKKWNKMWLDEHVSHAPDSAAKSPVFSMVIPPPNVTGILHMGHALNNTVQDILTRFKRMSGHETLWMPGTDHAGIATQNVVERFLKGKGESREDLGREKFIEKVWDWRNEYGSVIIEQLKRLGCSCDWDRLRFTMDEGLSEAVREVFVRLFDKGLIYKSHYIINWCPRCQTALSDEEVHHKEIQGNFYHLAYSIKDSDETLIIATTRPETMLGDTAVGVHPKDKRYSHLGDGGVILPILNRPLKVIRDSQIDPDFGTGALKITPAHDPVDFELGRKHKLPSINILNPDGTLNENAGPFEGMDRFEARKRILDELKKSGVLIKVEEHTHSIGHCYRCETVVEPYCSDQWFVKMKPLAEPAIKAVQKGDIRFHPDRWTKVYMEWMTQIRDWCISRQIWWGHRIPVYYTSSGEYTAAHSEEDARKRLGVPANEKLRQDEDVLDTWFSSWLWPFSTMGWPKEASELKSYYPTKTLVTAYEIIFFWVARMIMAGYEFMGDKPFSDIYIHGIVRDSKGAKMSKSKGNIVDPLDIINEFGADALRFSMISITAEGQDVYAEKERFELGRNFANKIWNASRFVLMNLKDPGVKSIDREDLQDADRWIMSRLHTTIQQVTQALEKYRFNEAANRIYDFFWKEYCDWYLEFVKNHRDSQGSQWILKNVLKTSLHILHPFMPYITEEIYQWIKEDKNSKGLTLSSWPEFDKSWVNASLEKDMSEVISQIQAIRNVRAEWKISPKQSLPTFCKTHQSKEQDLILRYAHLIKHMARIDSLEADLKLDRPSQSVVARIGAIETYVVLEGIIDIQKESQRIKSKIQELNGFLNKTQAKLSNEKFVSNAPAHVVEQEKKKLDDFKNQISQLEGNLSSLN